MPNPLPSLKPLLLMLLVVAAGLGLYFHFRRPTKFFRPGSAPTVIAKIPAGPEIHATKADWASTDPSRRAVAIRLLGMSAEPQDFKILEKLFREAKREPDRTTILMSMATRPSPDHRAFFESVAKDPHASPLEINLATSAMFRMLPPEEMKAKIIAVLRTNDASAEETIEAARGLKRFCPPERLDLLSNVIETRQDRRVLMSIASELVFFPERRSLALLKRIQTKLKIQDSPFDQIRKRMEDPNAPDPCKRPPTRR